MAGGTFTGRKKLPGTYVNTHAGSTNNLGVGLSGVVLLPLIGYDYGPAGKYIEIDAAEPDANKELLGRSIYDTNNYMLMIREALKGCGKVIVYIPTIGDKATKTVGGATVTAKYGGTLGNTIKVAIVANAAMEGYFNANVYFGDDMVESFAAVQTVGDLAAVESDYVVFSGTAATALTAASATALTGGTNGTVSTADFTAFLDDSESLGWNVLAFPYSTTTYATQAAAIVSKIKYFRDEVGKDVYAVLSGVDADYQGIFNIINGVYLTDGTQITPDLAAAFIAGICAGASYTESNTFHVYPGAKTVDGPLSHDQAVNAVNHGRMYFSYDSGWNVVVEYDINSLTTITSSMDESYKKGRVNRVLDHFRNLLRATFAPNKYNNDETGWNIMEGMGKSILKALMDEGAIHDVDFDTDFKVNRSLSKRDETYFDVGIAPTDSAEKLYFTVTTR